MSLESRGVAVKIHRIVRDHFEEEEPFYHEEAKGGRKAGNRKLDMNFIGYTYKADVEEQR